MNRADAVRLVHDLALVALGAGIALVVLGVATIHELRGKHRVLRRRVAQLEATAADVGPERRRPVSARHLHVADSRVAEQRLREAHKHGAAADRRVNP